MWADEHCLATASAAARRLDLKKILSIQGMDAPGDFASTLGVLLPPPNPTPPAFRRAASIVSIGLKAQGPSIQAAYRSVDRSVDCWMDGRRNRTATHHHHHRTIGYPYMPTHSISVSIPTPCTPNHTYTHRHGSKPSLIGASHSHASARFNPNSQNPPPRKPCRR